MNTGDRVAYNKQYYIDNKERILNRAKRLVRCKVCDLVMIQNSKLKHLKSQGHINAINRKKSFL